MRPWIEKQPWRSSQKQFFPDRQIRERSQVYTWKSTFGARGVNARAHPNGLSDMFVANVLDLHPHALRAITRLNETQIAELTTFVIFHHGRNAHLLLLPHTSRNDGKGAEERGKAKEIPSPPYFPSLLRASSPFPSSLSSFLRQPRPRRQLRPRASKLVPPMTCATNKDSKNPHVCESSKWKLKRLPPPCATLSSRNL